MSKFSKIAALLLLCSAWCNATGAWAQGAATQGGGLKKQHPSRMLLADTLLVKEANAVDNVITISDDNNESYTFSEGQLG